MDADWNASFVHVQGTAHDVAMKVTQTQEEDNAFFICDLRELKRRVQMWRQELPRVVPYFAIKSCTDPVVLNTLASEGVNFDCSNKLEIEILIGTGVAPSRIIYANPAKQATHLDFAKDAGVTLMTYDCVEELQKISDTNARFHVGAVRSSPESFKQAISQARELFDTGAQLGMKMSVLDIGGGFPGGVRKQDSFKLFCQAVRCALDLHFPEPRGISIIAEPGQFMVTAPYTMAVKVVAKRTRNLDVGGNACAHHDIYVNASRFNCVPQEMYTFLDISYKPLSPPYDRPRNRQSTLWGATCHPLDVFEDDVPFFDVFEGEWILVDNVGAYGLVKSCGFNGTGYPPVHYRTSLEDQPRVLKILEASPLVSGYSQPLGAVKKTPNFAHTCEARP